jgi:cytochrome bd-type quinol oxidase subunit 2
MEEILGWSCLTTAVGINLHAALVLVLASRRAAAADVRRLARRCAWSVAALLVLCNLSIAVSIVSHQPVGPLGSADRVRFLANFIAETLNTWAFAVAASILPLGAALWLRRRAQKMG